MDVGTSAAASATPAEPAPAEPTRGPPRGPAVPIRPIRRAFEQVADQLRSLIISGELPRDARLPNEATLARDFGVSRGTVREALRLLAAQNLIRTAKGPHGGSYVTLPTVERISEFVQTSINLLTETRHLSLADFLEARELLEVPLAGLAAQRRSEEHLAHLRATVPGGAFCYSPQQQPVYKSFHTVLVESCGNSLLKIAAHPLLTVFEQANLGPDVLSEGLMRTMNEEHSAILAAIEAGDVETAEREMRSHLESLRPVYRQAWPSAFRGGDLD